MKDWLYFKHQCSNQTPKDVVKLPYNFVTLVHKIYSLVYSLKIILCHFHSPCLQGFVMRFSHLRVLWVLRHGWRTDAQAWRCTCCCTLGHGLHTSCISDCSGLWKAPEQICVIIFLLGLSGCRCHIHLWIQSILQLREKGAKVPAMTRWISNNQIVFGKNVDRTGLNSHFPISWYWFICLLVYFINNAHFEMSIKISHDWK